MNIIIRPVHSNGLSIAPAGVPDVIADRNDLRINISWFLNDSDINGFIVVFNGSSIVFNSSVSHTVFTNLTPGVSHTISVFAYIDLLSVMREITIPDNLPLHISPSSMQLIHAFFD